LIRRNKAGEYNTEQSTIRRVGNTEAHSTAYKQTPFSVLMEGVPALNFVSIVHFGLYMDYKVSEE
jgi:hypothetical protein